MVTPVDNRVPLTGNGLIDGLTWGAAWDFGNDSRILTYSLSINDNPSGGPWTTVLADGARRALQEWANVANLTFVESGSGTVYNQSPADIAIILTGNDLQSEAPGIVGLGVPPSPSFANVLLDQVEATRAEYPRPEGDVALDNYYSGFNYLNPGGVGLWIMLHEIGHALGLKHTDESWGGRPTFASLGISNLDSNLYTVMSYTDPAGQPAGTNLSSGNAATPMPLDILAIQQIYGANTQYHTGDDSYYLLPSNGVRTLWDAGGIDTLSIRADVGNDTTSATIDLREGYFSSSGSTRLAIAYNAIIENAVGGAGNDMLTGNAAANLLTGGSGNDSLDGGAGIDWALFSSSLSRYTITQTATGLTVANPSGSDGTDTLLSMERLGFTDAYAAFDTDGNAGQVYRLYKAAFARSPDLPGLGGWIDGMDHGLSLEQVASAFASSTEFQSLYGTSTSNEDFVLFLYLNALGRAPESGAVSSWAGQLASGALTRAQLLVQFSESTENKSAVQDDIEGGILYATAQQATVATQGLTLTGTSGVDSLYGSVGKDTLSGLEGNDTLDGGAGVDAAVYSGARSAYTINRTSTGLTVSGGTEGTDTLGNVERLTFGDGGLAFDVDGNAGQVYRLYQAAFARTPDVAGLSDWVRGMDGGMILRSVATGFIGSAEFQGLYGASPSHEAFVNLLYQNVLHRAPDEGGQSYWLDELGRGMTREMALIGFSESNENQVVIIGVIQDGIALAV